MDAERLHDVIRIIDGWCICAYAGNKSCIHDERAHPVKAGVAKPRVLALCAAVVAASRSPKTAELPHGSSAFAFLRFALPQQAALPAAVMCVTPGSPEAGSQGRPV